MTDKTIRICTGKHCTERGSNRILDTLKSNYPSTKIEESECMGYCELGPNITMDGKIFHECKNKDIVSRLEKGDGIIIKKLTEEDLQLDDELL
jgi:NADH:ubiquinone oxidoreductase subunit E